MRALAVVMLLAACRGSHAKKHDAGPAGSASTVSALVPWLPPSADPLLFQTQLDEEIRRFHADAKQTIPKLLLRASIRGDLEDYQDALALAQQWIEHDPKSENAWNAQVRVLTRVHRFADARAALAKLRPLEHEQHDADELAAAIDEATGHLDKSQAYRDEAAKIWPSTQNLVQRAAGLALAGKFDDALAIMPKAAASLRDDSPALFAWLLFQWGRIYEQKGELAAARQFYEAGHIRLATLEVTTHLAQTMIATGDTNGAKKLVEATLVEHRHPDLLGLAVQLGHPELAAEATQAWERYVKALPLAFSDHAARYFLGPGKDPARALALAQQNLVNRDTPEARALVAEAAVAAGDAKAACAAAEPLVNSGIRAYRFAAWKAMAACGRTADADRLARDLGIH